jgi:hypothetical protein
MGRSVHMNEAVVFISIMIATILKGILGALLIVPLLATVVVIGGYIQRRVVGLAPFEEGGVNQFVTPPEAQAPRRKWTWKERRERLHSGNVSEGPEAAPFSKSRSEQSPIQEKTEE